MEKNEPQKKVLEAAQFLLENATKIKNVVLIYSDMENQISVNVPTGIPRAGLSLMMQLFQKVGFDYIFEPRKPQAIVKEEPMETIPSVEAVQ
jgi:hypothetical protein